MYGPAGLGLVKIAGGRGATGRQCLGVPGSQVSQRAVPTHATDLLFSPPGRPDVAGGCPCGRAPM